MYIHFMCAYVYLHLNLFVRNSTYLLKLEVQRYDSTQHDALKALSHQAQGARIDSQLAQELF